MSDIFVFYDTAQYTKGDYHNRNTIKGPNGPILLSLPVQVKLGQTIREVSFDNRVLPKHLRTISESYKKAKAYAEIFPILEEIYAYEENSIAEFNMRTISKFVEVLALPTKLVKLSDIIPVLESKSTEALIEISKHVGATTYLSGAGGRDYLMPERFQEEGIILQFQDFHHPIYPQLRGEFLPYMSIIDYLMNVGISNVKKYFQSL